MILVETFGVLMTYKIFIENVSNQLSHLYPVEEGRAIAVRLLQNYCKISHYQHIISPNENIDEHCLAQMDNAIEQLKSARPLQYVLGFEEFYGRTFFVEEGVLIPRPETEELVRWIVEDCINLKLKENEFAGKGLNILDAACGSGCIGITLAIEINKCNVYAIDLSAKALEITQKNAKKLVPSLSDCFTVFKSDLLKTPNNQCFIKNSSLDILVSNPPYVRDSERTMMRKNVLEFEPEEALFVSDIDPLIFYKSLSEWGNVLLKKGGLIYFEINESFAKEVVQILKSSGFSEVYVKEDFRGKERMVKGIL